MDQMKNLLGFKKKIEDRAQRNSMKEQKSNIKALCFSSRAKKVK